MKQTRTPSAAFSLIELLVATAILVVLVLIMSTIFHQASVSWDSGERKAKGNLTGRAVLGFMSRELSEAVVDTNLLGVATVDNDSSEIVFYTMRGTNGTTHRIARKITYSYWDSDGTIRRNEQVMTAIGNYDDDSWDPASTPAFLGDNIAKLKFYTSDGSSHSTSMPAWVRIELAIERSGDVSGVGAWSLGQDGREDTEDDIRSQ